MQKWMKILNHLIIVNHHIIANLKELIKEQERVMKCDLPLPLSLEARIIIKRRDTDLKDLLIDLKVEEVQVVSQHPLSKQFWVINKL